MKQKRGFTLVELIIVIAVIGVLAAILIPVFSNVISKANAKSALSDARNAVTVTITDKDLETADYPEEMTIIVNKGNGFYGYIYKASEGKIRTDDDTLNLLNAKTLDEAVTEMGVDPNNELSNPDLPGTVHVYIAGEVTPMPSPTVTPIPSATAEPTITPTPTPSPSESITPTANTIYYYGNTYRNASNHLMQTASNENMPAAIGNYPMSIINEPNISGNTVTMTHSLPSGYSFNRTFTFNPSSYTVIGYDTYYKCTETTDWKSCGISGAVFVEKTAGNKVSGSLALEALKNTNNDAYIGQGKNIILVEDITLTDEWLPIAFNGVMNGVFDGMGYSVSGVKISSPAVNAIYGVGFIANVGNTGSLVNLMLPNANVEHINSNSQPFYVGIAVGKNAGTVKNVHTDGTASFKNSEKGLGGVVGYCQVTNTIVNCSSAAVLTNSHDATGGILGRADAGVVSVTDCHFYGSINSTASHGGIVGYVYSSATVYINDCTCGSYPTKP